jgi:hypothetical protein
VVLAAGVVPMAAVLRLVLIAQASLSVQEAMAGQVQLEPLVALAAIFPERLLKTERMDLAVAAALILIQEAFHLRVVTAVTVLSGILHMEAAVGVAVVV